MGRSIRNICRLLVLLLGFVHGSDPHVLRQLVMDWPVGYDATGTKWMVFDLYQARTHWLDQDTVGSYTTYSPGLNAVRWTAEIGNFPNWQNGDTIVAFGSWDSAYANDPASYGSNINHTGFYWLFSDTLDATQATQTWSLSDTLRSLPKPIVYKTDVAGSNDDSVWIKIPNPMETRRPDQIDYDVLGYWIWADTTGTGTPDAFSETLAVEVGFAPVQGDLNDTTIYGCFESELVPVPEIPWPTYIAYKLVVRPDTVNRLGESMGYISFYLSVNPDSSVLIFWTETGIEENKTGVRDHHSGATIFCGSFLLPEGKKCRVFDIMGQVVTSDKIRPGIYFIEVDGKIAQKVVKIK